MSADNFVGVYQTEAGKWIVSEGCMSIEIEDCQYRGGSLSEHDSRENALVAAHDAAKEMTILEYGVVEFGKIGPPCGHCYVCVHERHIVADDLPRCDAPDCGEVITASEWQIHTGSGIYHSRCEPGRARVSN